MSGLGFSDDTKILQFLQKSNFDKINIDVLSPFVDEEELINIANQAYGTISMSYHGCIFSMIGGCPSVAITSGDYYDYKYIGFDSYSGGQGLPIIDLNNLNIEKATSQICDYFAKYSAERTANTREEAAQIIEKWYRQIADDTKEKFSE
jgi:polysaccharide pyruvyl transferase WcaK-like protein